MKLDCKVVDTRSSIPTEWDREKKRYVYEHGKITNCVEFLVMGNEGNREKITVEFTGDSPAFFEINREYTVQISPKS